MKQTRHQHQIYYVDMTWHGDVADSREGNAGLGPLAIQTEKNKIEFSPPLYILDFV